MESAKHDVQRKTLEERNQMSDLERLRHSCAPLSNRWIAGSQSCTVSNFSRASFINSRVELRCCEEEVSMADVSLAGLVRESRCRARRVSSVVRVDSSEVVLDRRSREAERVSMRSWDSVTSRLELVLGVLWVSRLVMAVVPEAEAGAAATAAMVVVG